MDTNQTYIQKKSQNMESTLSQRNPALAQKVHQLSLTLHPLVQLTTGLIHPSFPTTLLSFWCLTSSELDELAHFYHQRTPCVLTKYYPCPVRWERGAQLEEKRRRLGRFIGLRGCESPVLNKISEEDVWKEVQRERERRAEEEGMRRKMGGY